jgi:hypothetical protein
MNAAMSLPMQPSTHAALPHVLVVDDDPTIRELVSDYLGKNELKVTAVADGRAMPEGVGGLADGGLAHDHARGRPRAAALLMDCRALVAAASAGPRKFDSSSSSWMFPLIKSPPSHSTRNR